MSVCDEHISIMEVKTLLPTCIMYSPVAFVVVMPYGSVRAHRDVMIFRRLTCVVAIKGYQMYRSVLVAVLISLAVSYLFKRSHLCTHQIGAPDAPNSETTENVLKIYGKKFDHA